MLFAHLKRILQLERLRLRGLSGASDEFLPATELTGQRPSSRCVGATRTEALAASRSKRFNRRLEVIGRFALEQNTFGGSRMHESERPRMKHRTHCFDVRAGVVAEVHALADQRMAELG